MGVVPYRQHNDITRVDVYLDAAFRGVVQRPAAQQQRALALEDSIAFVRHTMKVMRPVCLENTTLKPSVPLQSLPGGLGRGLGR